MVEIAPARQQRADARRNVASILDAAVTCLVTNPDASVAEIAQAAGVGRVTLYGHFKTRADLVEAALIHVLEQAHGVLETVDTTGEPRVALVRFAEASWRIVDRFRSVHQTAQRELPAERIRGGHDPVMARVRGIIERGQGTGAFRTDLPVGWLVTTAFSLMHAAAEDCTAGRLDPSDAAGVVAATLLAALTPVGEPVPPADGSKVI